MAKIFVSTIINCDYKKVWKLVKNFNGLPAWHHLIANSSIEENKADNEVGAIRKLILHDGAIVRETLLALDDLHHTLSYDIVESDMGVSNYIANISIKPVTTNNSTYIEWNCEFEPPAEKKEELIKFIGEDVFANGFEALKKTLA